MALPYGDVDADSLQAAGLAKVVIRSLPGSPEGTARTRCPRTARPGPSHAPGPTRPPRRPRDGAGRRRRRGRIVADALDVEPRTDVAWAADGTLRPETLLTLQAGGVDRVVLGSAGLTDGETAVGPPAAARRPTRR